MFRALCAACAAEANEQHYELPPAFFLPIMGSRLKYSCCLFNKGTHDDDLNKAEEDSLAQVEEEGEGEGEQEEEEVGKIVVVGSRSR